jgi:tRNA(Arg) A34 adenosine deaminase TadA
MCPPIPERAKKIVLGFAGASRAQTCLPVDGPSCGCCSADGTTYSRLEMTAAATFHMSFSLALPDWAAAELTARVAQPIPCVEDRMRLVIGLARANFERDTGGPFAAAVFEEATGRVISVGVNRVVPTHCSSAHAEVMALSLAQRAVGTHDLGGTGQPAHQLVVNWAPCAMCCGAALWSGVRSLVVAGSGPDLEEITGFDEGPIHPSWAAELDRRGVRVVDGVLRVEACEMFRAFARSGRLVYNARQG